ncbi:MAG TPA: hypothetical protein ENK91_04740 [Bacteroidetes bacterium]|nr:hypothetical protein [Bacteroidota bacterium]
MNILTKRFLIILIFSLFANYNVNSQDIFDLQHSIKYANYLFSTKQYKLATEELERVVFMDSSNLSYKIKLLRAYRMGGFYESGIKRAIEFSNGETYRLQKNLAVEYLTMLLLYGANKDIDNFLSKNNTLSEKDKTLINWSNQIVEGNYKKASEIISKFDANKKKVPKEVFMITREGLDHHFKSPFLAGSLSTVIPGLGKVYTKNYVDGIFAFAFIAGTAWQAYKGFDKKGIKSINGWIFGGLSLGFYLGNIYGSVKSAKKYNKFKRDETKYKVFDFIQSYDF